MRVSMLSLLLIVSSACSSSNDSATDEVSGSAECNAYCAKVDSLACGSPCDRAAVCKTKEGSCAAAARAKLDCEVKTGSWRCAGSGYAVAFSCSDFHELCGAGLPDTGATGDTGTRDSGSGTGDASFD